MTLRLVNLLVILGDGGAAASALAFSSGEIGDVDSVTVEGTFTGVVFSPTSDYVSGFTIKVNAVSTTISSGTRQGDTTKIHWVITPKIDIDDTVTVEYLDSAGDIEDTGGTQMGDLAATAYTNYVGSLLYFDDEESSALVVVL